MDLLISSDILEVVDFAGDRCEFWSYSDLAGDCSISGLAGEDFIGGESSLSGDSCLPA